jgi:hypothetical protein
MNAEEIKTKLEEFDKRWDIIENSEYEVEFNKFKTRIINLLNSKKSSFNIFPAGNYTEKFFQIWGLIYLYDYNHDCNFDKYLIPFFLEEKNEKIFYKKIQSVFYLPEKRDNIYTEKSKLFIDVFYYEISDILSYSYVNLFITRNETEVILYPKGEKEFDEKIVNEILKFLNPDSNQHFTESLKFYLEGTDRSFIKSAESLRRTLEEFLRFKLQNNKGLDANIKEIMTLHKRDGKDKQIRNVINNVFDYLDSYFNENSKHQDGDIDENECEYLIYQTGVLLRYINKLKI